MAHEFHIPPSAVMAESPRVQITMMRYLKWRAVELRKSASERGRKG